MVNFPLFCLLTFHRIAFLIYLTVNFKDISFYLRPGHLEESPGIEMAAAAIDNGEATRKLDALIAYTRENG